LAYIFSLMVWVYLHSNLCGGLQKTHLCCKSAGWKRIFTSNSRSMSFKVIHFAISYRPTRGSMST